MKDKMPIHPILRSVSETRLLEMVLEILAKDGSLTGIDKMELAEINNELARRDAIKLAKKYHPTLEGV